MRRRPSWPPSRWYVSVLRPSTRVSSSITRVPACTSIRNAPGPNSFDASTIPLDSHAPRLPRAAASSSVGPSSADWFTFATTSIAPVPSWYRQSRAVVAAGSVEPNGNCWLEPGSSVIRRKSSVDSMLSGWWISSIAFTGLSSPSIRRENEVTLVGSFLSSTSFQTRPFDEVKGLPPALVAPRPLSTT